MRTLLALLALAACASAEHNFVYRRTLEIDDTIPNCDRSWNDEEIVAAYSHIVVDRAGIDPTTCAVIPPVRKCITKSKQVALQARDMQFIISIGGESAAGMWATCLADDVKVAAMATALEAFAKQEGYNGLNFAVLPSVTAQGALSPAMAQPWSTVAQLTVVYTQLQKLLNVLKTSVPAAQVVSVTFMDADVAKGSLLFDQKEQLLKPIVDAVDYVTIQYGHVAFPGNGFASGFATPATLSNPLCMPCADPRVPTRACGCATSAFDVYEKVVQAGDNLPGWTSKIVVGSCVGTNARCNVTGDDVFSKIYMNLGMCGGGFAALATENSFNIPIAAQRAAYDTVMARRKTCLDEMLFEPVTLTSKLSAIKVYPPMLKDYTLPLRRPRVPFYKGSRFDGSSMIGGGNVSAEDRDGALWWKHNLTSIPNAWDTAASRANNVFGFAEEWGCGAEGLQCAAAGGTGGANDPLNGVLAWDATGANLDFLKIGVGRLRRRNAQDTYSSFTSYTVVQPLVWEVIGTPTPQLITLQATDSLRGFGYAIRRDISYDAAGKVVVTVKITNSGTQPFSTKHLALNCLDMDRRALGGDYSLEFPVLPSLPTADCVLCKSLVAPAASPGWWSSDPAFVFNDTAGAVAKSLTPLAFPPNAAAGSDFSFRVYATSERRYAPGMKKEHVGSRVATSTSINVPRTGSENVCVQQESTVTLAPTMSAEWSYTLDSSVSFKPAMATTASASTIIAFIAIFIVSIVAIVAADKFTAKSTDAKDAAPTLDE